MKTKADNKVVAVFIILMALLVVLAVFFGIVAPIFRSDTVMLKSGVIKTSLKSSSGENHTLEAKFAVEVDRSNRNSIDSKILYEIVQDAVNNLDYDVLTDYDGLQYLKSCIMKRLEDDGRFSDEAVAAIEGIYVTNIVSDFPMEEDEPENRFMNIFRGLFQNSN